MELNKQFQHIDWLSKCSLDACGDNIEMLSHWARYLCVLSAGFLENALQIIYSDFVNGSATESVQNYAISRLLLIHNPKTRRFIETARAFKKDWGNDLEIFVNKEGRREAIDSIMQNRHLIAHGQSSAITIVRVRDYLRKAVVVVEFIERQCGL